MRPSTLLFAFFALLATLDIVMAAIVGHGPADTIAHRRQQQAVVAPLGLTDLCGATEARYTRHPAVSDMVVPFMDHPGAIEHFPTGSFWAPPAE